MPSLRVSLIQTNLHWEDKEKNLAMFAEKINNLQEPTHVIILPEMFSTGFSMKPELLAEKMDGLTVDWMKKMSREKKVILTGSIIVEEEGHYFNRLIWMQPDGKCGYYDKRHLFAYAEEDKHYSPGNKRLIASVNGWKVNLLVCYDLRFPAWSRQSPAIIPGNGDEGGHEYDLLIYVANWPEKRSTAWKTLLQARAIENQAYVIGVNRVGKDGNGIEHSGDSMVIDPLGELLYHKKDREDIFTITLEKNHLEKIRARFPFLRDADDFTISL